MLSRCAGVSVGTKQGVSERCGKSGSPQSLISLVENPLSFPFDFSSFFGIISLRYSPSRTFLSLYTLPDSYLRSLLLGICGWRNRNDRQLDLSTFLFTLFLSFSISSFFLFFLSLRASCPSPVSLEFLIIESAVRWLLVGKKKGMHSVDLLWRDREIYM